MHIKGESKVNNGYISIGMLSPERILELSNGEVRTSDTLNYKNYHPASEGLFSEKIFGPINDWECRCGKYKKIRYKGVVCDNCGVTVTLSAVRRIQFGHIELGCYVVLPQYLYGGPSILATVLDIPQSYLEQIVFGGYHIDVAGFWEQENKLNTITNSASIDIPEECGTDGIFEVLKNLDINVELRKIDEKLEYTEGYLAQPYLHRKEVLESFVKSDSKPEWMVTSKILVLPAGLRPIVEHNGKMYSSEINDRYRLIINRCRLFEQLLLRKSPEIVLQSQRRMIQISVDSLFDSTLEREEHDKAIRESLLNRRQIPIDRFVDYSAKGMVVAKKEIDIVNIGIPIENAVELFRPFIARELVSSGTANNIKKAYKMLDGYHQSEINDVLRRIEKTFVVVVCADDSRIFSFNVQLTTDSCFSLNPITYSLMEMGISDKAMQIRVYAQLSDDSAEEAINKFGIKNKIVSEYSDEIKLLPDRYAIEWLSKMSQETKSRNKKFISRGEVFCAYENGCIEMTELVDVRCHTPNGFDFEERTTLGRIIINEFLPQNMGVVNRSGLRNKYRLEYNFIINPEDVLDICENIYYLKGAKEYIEFVRSYEETLARYYNAVNVVCADSDVRKIKRQNAWNMFSKEFSFIKNRVSKIELCDNDCLEQEFKLTYRSARLQQYAIDYLHNRIVSKDIYDYADKIAAEGDILSKHLIQKLKDRNIESLSIYSGEIVNCVFPQDAFGKTVSYNPFVVSMLALNDALSRLSYHEARTFFDILLANNVLRTDKFIFNLVKMESDEGEIGRNLNAISNTEEGILDFSTLKKNEIVETKVFLLYSMLSNARIKISVRLLLILVIALMNEPVLDSSGEHLMIASDLNTLSFLGEHAIKSVQLDVDNPVVKRSFGKINTLSRAQNVKDRYFTEEIKLFDFEDELMSADDYIFELDDWDDWDEV